MKAQSIRITSWFGLLATAADDTNAIQADSTGTATGNVLANDAHAGGTVTEVHAYPALVGNPYVLSYGTITMNADGSYSYDVDEDHQAVIGLRVGEVLEEIGFLSSDRWSEFGHWCSRHCDQRHRRRASSE